jgi:hypothetical protein
MTPTGQGKAAAHSPKLTAAFQTSYPAHRSERTECATDPGTLEDLQRRYTAHGLNLFQLAGRVLVATGPGVPSRTMPDLRCAWLYLRQLTGAV